MFDTSSVFSRIVLVDAPTALQAEAETRRAGACTLAFEADGPVPFPQIILRGNGPERVFAKEALAEQEHSGQWRYEVVVPAGTLAAGRWQVQAEGCRKEDWRAAGGGDWVKAFAEFEVSAPPRARSSVADNPGVKVYYGIHKHMHQPYYNATDKGYWDGEKQGIFSSRHGAYSSFVPMAVRHYLNGGLDRAGLSVSWSGTLLEQLNGRGGFPGWSDELRQIAQETTSGGHPRCAMVAFGFYHPLMPLIPARNIVKHLRKHARICEEVFGVPPTKTLFPPETAFHVRMIPALREAGIERVIYDSLHRYRACREYPYAGREEGMLPPNAAEQVNPPVDDWTGLNNVWCPGKVSPSCLRPEWITYTDPEGREHRIIGVPAERYIGNEDARGGFGALQYPNVLGQLYEAMVDAGTFDPKHPPFFLLHSDGDNYGGGTDSYYGCNTERMVAWLQEDPRFELITIDDYLEQFPPDPANAVHLEPGSWAGADNGDPQFKKWFSLYDQPYSPDLNSWAVLTALQNIVHSLEDVEPQSPLLARAEDLMLTAETSCYWYWTGQDVWDQQVTNAANAALEHIGGVVDKLAQNDQTGPTIFAPWPMPENPGGKMWGEHGSIVDAPREGRIHTFVYDVSGLKTVSLVLRTASGGTRLLPSQQHPYPCHTGAKCTAEHVTFDLPVGVGDCRYVIEATDNRGNTSRTALERVYLQ